jgi:hypothetical protein
MTKLIGGARVVVTEGEGIVARLRKLEEETTFANTGAHGLQGEGGGGAGWAERPGGPAGRWADWVEC